MFDRARDTERDLRRAGRNWTYDDNDDRGYRHGRRYGRRGSSRHDDDVDELYDAVRNLATKDEQLSRNSESKPTGSPARTSGGSR